MACALPHKSAASVNTSQERCDNFSITLGRRERCLCPRSWQVGLRGALCTLAALPLFLGTEGSKVRGKCTPEYVCNADVDLYSGFQFQSVQKGVKWTELIWQQRRVEKKLPPSFISMKPLCRRRRLWKKVVGQRSGTWLSFCSVMLRPNTYVRVHIPGRFPF